MPALVGPAGQPPEARAMIARLIEAGEQLAPFRLTCMLKCMLACAPGGPGGWKSLIGSKTTMADSVPCGRA